MEDECVKKTFLNIPSNKVTRASTRNDSYDVQKGAITKNRKALRTKSIPNKYSRTANICADYRDLSVFVKEMQSQDETNTLVYTACPVT